MSPGSVGELPGLTDSGTRQAEEETMVLSGLIDQFNERFRTEWNPGNLLDDVRSELLEGHRMRTAATANDRSNFGYVHDPAFD
ncbi:MAG: hypothetical protein MI919_16870 [Holophagales bacterium]|nr:hypothetical protein [Holophagales bacterium]